jgi:hypothetical protein
MEFYEHQGLEIVIPKLYGAEARKPMSGGGGGGERRKRWSPEEFLKELAENTDQNVAALAKSALTQADDHADLVVDWKGAAGPLFKYHDATRGTFFTFGALDHRGEFGSVERFAERCNQQELPRQILNDYLDALLAIIPGSSRWQKQTSLEYWEGIEYEDEGESLRSLLKNQDKWFAAMESAIAKIKKATTKK